MKRRRAFHLQCTVAVILVLAGVVFAQTDTATLSGRVTDQTGAVVPGVEVEVTHIDTNVSVATTTDSNGLYAVTNLRPGRYRMIVRKTGFKEIVKTDIVLYVQDALLHNFTLEVGSVAQSVTVVGEAGRITTSPAVSTVVNRQFVENIPLNGRSFQQLITLTPGVVLTPAGFDSPGQFSVNGQRSNANYFTVDGVSANFGIPAAFSPGQSAGGTVPALTIFGGTNSLVSVDAMQEFRIQTSSFAPEFGRQPGGQISIVTRSGSNEFHGTLFNYFRNDKLDATDWFANQNGLPKPPLRQNDFGGVLGGPVVRDRTFFFFSYEGLRLRQPQVSTVAVPSLSSRQAAVPEIQPYLNVYPLPNGPDLGNGFTQFTGSYSDKISLDAFSLRIDHNFSPNWGFFGRFSHSPSDSTVRFGSLSAQETTSLTTQTLTLGTTRVFNPQTSNELRVNLSRTKGSSSNQLTDFGGAVPLPDSAFFPAPFDSSNGSVNFQIFAGGTTFVVGTNGANQQRQINLVDNLSYIVGPHQLKFGVDYRWMSPRFGPEEYSQFMAFFGVTSSTLSGIASFAAVASNVGVATVFHNFSAYAQDTWRASPRLTLTYGLRWEFNPPPTGRHGKTLFKAVGIDDPDNLMFAPEGTDLYDTTYDNLSPRVGVAYQLSQTQGRETVLRGGFGLYYDLGASRAAGDAAFGFPFRSLKQLFNVPYPLDAATAAPPPLPDPSNPVNALSVAFDPNFELPRTYQWNVTLEQSIGVDQSLSAAYVAAVGRQLLRAEELFFPNPLFSQVRVVRNASTSDYHALQMQFQRRMSRGVQALASYTWSHAIDIASQDAFNGTGAAFVDPTLDRGNAAFDVRHSFSAAVSYEIPTPAAGRVGSAILGDWAVDSIIRTRSATPVDLIGNFNFSGFRATLRPDLVVGESIYLDDSTVAGGRRLNPDAFAFPAGEQGTLGRNVVRGFSLWQVDLSVRRHFRLTEKFNLQFRTEFFNLFNHPNFANPSGSLFSSFFGRSISMLGQSLGAGSGADGGFNPLYQVGGPRSIQFALKLVY